MHVEPTTNAGPARRVSDPYRRARGARSHRPVSTSHVNAPIASAHQAGYPGAAAEGEHPDGKTNPTRAPRHLMITWTTTL